MSDEQRTNEQQQKRQERSVQLPLVSFLFIAASVVLQNGGFKHVHYYLLLSC